jgi:hypothetical protein
VRVLHLIVNRLGSRRVARQAVPLPQRVEAVSPAGQELVHIGLVPGVEHDHVVGRLEDPVQCEGDLDHPQVRTQMPTGARHRFDQKLSELGRECRQLRRREASQILGAGDLGHQRPNRRNRTVYGTGQPFQSHDQRLHSLPRGVTGRAAIRR